MFYFVNLIGGKRFIITQEERNALTAAYDAGVKMAQIRETTIFLSSMSSIISAEDYITEECRDLAKRDKFMCHAGEIHDGEDHCSCTESLIHDVKPLLAPTEPLQTRIMPDGTREDATPKR